MQTTGATSRRGPGGLGGLVAALCFALVLQGVDGADCDTCCNNPDPENSTGVCWFASERSGNYLTMQTCCGVDPLGVSWCCPEFTNIPERQMSCSKFALHDCHLKTKEELQEDPNRKQVIIITTSTLIPFFFCCGVFGVFVAYLRRRRMIVLEQQLDVEMALREEALNPQGLPGMYIPVSKHVADKNSRPVKGDKMHSRSPKVSRSSSRERKEGKDKPKGSILKSSNRA